MSEDPLTFSEIRKAQKEEARLDKLSDVSEDFFYRVAQYLKRKEDVSGQDREYRHAKRVLDKMVSLREDKIVKNAKLAVKSDISSSTMNLLPTEKELFLELKEVFGKHRKRIDEITENGDDIEIEAPVEETEEEPEEEDENEGYKKVKIISSVPEFMGTDLEAYGPYEEGEEAEIPEENAEILLNRGDAEVAE